MNRRVCVLVVSICLGTGEAYAQQSTQPASADTATPTPLPLSLEHPVPAEPSTATMHFSVLGGPINSDGPIDSRRAGAGLGPTWQIKTGATFHAPGGFDVSANLVARHGSNAPLFMTEPLGTDAAIRVGDDLRAGTLWDTELRIRKTLVTGKGVQLTVFGDLFNVVNVNPSSSTAPISTTLTSPTFRVGIGLDFK